MKLEARTLQILKNYATINPSLQFLEGNTLSTISPVKTVLAKATIKEYISSSFAIYELNKFLSVLSLFNEPGLQINSSHIVITDNNQHVDYICANPDNIVKPERKTIDLPSIDIQFNLKSNVLQSVQKAMNVLGLPEFAITGSDGGLFVQGINVKNPSSDKFSIRIGDTNKEFRMIILSENLKVLQEDYDVLVSFKGIINLKGNDIEYWIATENTSTNQ